MTNHVARLEMDLWLEIEGQIYHVSQFNSYWGMNAIPSAQAILAVGVNVHTEEPATIHKTAHSLLRMKPCTVYFEPKGEWRPQGPEWPSGPKVIFRGYVTGFGSQKLRGSMRVTVSMTHWLTDMAFSSTMSNWLHPSSAFQYSGRGCYSANNPTGKGKAVFVADTLATHKSVCSLGAISSDFWGSVLQPILCGMVDFEAFPFAPKNACKIPGGNKNNRAKRALEKFEGGQCSKVAKSKWYKPLSFDLAEAKTQGAKAIAGLLTSDMIQSFTNTTVWDLLVHKYLASFDFAIVPRVESALVAPFVPGLQTPFQVKLRADEMSYLGLDAMLSKPLRGVMVMGQYDYATMSRDMKGPPITNKNSAGGCYAPPMAEDDGLVLIQPARPWMSNVTSVSHDAQKTLTAGGRDPTSTATTPGAGGGRGDETGQTPADTAIASKGMFDRLAHSIYCCEMLRGRFGVVYGKLRFDIAPGSTVYVENTRELHLKEADLLGSEDYVATVVRVSIEIDAEGARAGTSFQLAHVRTKAENDEGVVSVDSHPLYKGAVYPGAPLIDEYLFD